MSSEARFFYFRGLVELSASSGVNKYCKGFWGSNPKYYLGVGCGEPNNEYVGVRFLLNGQTHYGWIRLTVTTSPDPNGPPLTAKITGYAYETVANKAIKAGTAATAAAEVRGAERHAGNAWASADLNAAENRCTVLHIGHWHLKQICSPLESIIDSEI